MPFMSKKQDCRQKPPVRAPKRQRGPRQRRIDSKNRRIPWLNCPLSLCVLGPSRESPRVYQIGTGRCAIPGRIFFTSIALKARFAYSETDSRLHGGVKSPSVSNSVL